MTAFFRDLRYGWRSLRRAPWYALSVTGVLAVGIALTTVAFAVTDGVLFKPLPFLRSGELFLVRADASAAPRIEPPAVSWREVEAWTQAAPELSFTVVSQAANLGTSIDERFFEVTGRPPLLGGFVPADFDWLAVSQRTGQRIRPVLLSYEYWRKEFGGDPTVVGRTIIRTSREDFVSGIRIAGVLARDFVFPLDLNQEPPEMLSPIPREFRANNRRDYHVIARVGADADLAAVTGRLRAASANLPEAVPPPGHEPAELIQRIRFDEVRLIPLADHLARRQRPALALVLSASAVLLLLACVNLAGLVAARNIERRRELAVRVALGARGWAVVRALLAELAPPAAIATGAALLIARPLLIWTVDLLPPTMTLLKAPAIDYRVYAAALILSVVTTGLVALWPARMAGRLGATSRFEEVDATATRPVRRLARPLVAIQVAAAFVLLTAGGLTASSLAAAWWNDAGFQRDRMLLLELFVNESANRTETIEKLAAVPSILSSVHGVDAVAVSSIQPLFARQGIPWTTVVPSGWTGEITGVSSRQVTANYFDLMGLRLVDGRWPARGEWNDPRVAIVSERAARMLWPDRSAIGRQLVPRFSKSAPAITVIGIVGDARYAALDTDPIGDIYVPFVADPGRYGAYFHVRTTGPADEVLGPALAALAGRGYVLEQASTHTDALFASVRHRALPAWLFGSLGAGAIVVLATGIFGLLAMSAAQRTREVGIRIALGATRARVVGLLVREQLASLLLGLCAGALLSYWGVQLLESQLYGIGAHDLTVWSAVAATIVVVALGATLVPALRAVQRDPIAALRTE